MPLQFSPCAGELIRLDVEDFSGFCDVFLVLIIAETLEDEMTVAVFLFEEYLQINSVVVLLRDKLWL